MARTSYENLMKFNPYKTKERKELFKNMYQLTRIANKRIEQMERAGYHVIDTGHFTLNKDTKRYTVDKINDLDVGQMQRKINNVKNFLNSPGNDISKIKKEKRRLRSKFKGERITESDYKMFRGQAGYLWRKMDEADKESVGSEPMETIIIRNIKEYSSFKSRLRHIQEDIEEAKREQKRKDDEFWKRQIAREEERNRREGDL